MGMIFYELVQFISADVKGVIVVQKVRCWVHGFVLMAYSVHLLSGQFSSQHIQ